MSEFFAMFAADYYKIGHATRMQPVSIRAWAMPSQARWISASSVSCTPRPLPCSTVFRSGAVPSRRLPCAVVAQATVCASAAVVVRLNRLGKSVPARFASRYYAEATVGVDLFARGDAGQLSSQGLPWDLAVGFDGSAVVGRFVPVAPVGEKNLAFELRINGQVVQSGSTDRLITGVDEGISFLSRYYILKTGDLVYTGSPGVPAPLRIGDRLEGYLDGEKLLDFHIR